MWVYEYNYTEPGNLPDSVINGSPSQLMQFDYDGDLGQYIPPLTNDGAGFVNQHRTPAGWYPSHTTALRTAPPTTITRFRTRHR